MLVSKEDIFSFIDSSINFGKKVKISIDKIGRIEVPDRLGSWKRARLFVYYGQMQDNMENRIIFILDIIKNKIQRADILDCIIRGLFESYCRMLYIYYTDEKEKFKRIIWGDIYTICLMEVHLRAQKEIRPLATLGYSIIKSYEDKCKLPVFSRLIYEIKKSFGDISETPLIRNIRKNMQFPGTREIIKKYYDESKEPVIRKTDLLRFYSRLSEQIHGNPYFEIPFQEIKGVEFRLLASIILVYCKFLELTSRIGRMDNEYIQLLGRLKALRPDFSMLWGLTTRFVQ